MSLFGALARASSFGLSSGNYEVMPGILDTSGLTPTEAIALEVREAGRAPDEISQDLVCEEIQHSIELEQQAKLMTDLAAARDKAIASLTTISEKKAMMAQASLKAQQTIALKHHLPMRMEGARTTGLKNALQGTRLAR